MAFEDPQLQKLVRVDLATKYPEVVLCVGKITFGEKAREKMPKNSKQDQKRILASAVCALLNSGGGVVKAEIENENYNLQRDEIGLDLQDIFRSLLLSPDLTKYLDFVQQDNNLLIFIKTWNSERAISIFSSAKPRICSLSSGLYAKSGASLSHMTPTEALLFLEEKQNKARRELKAGTPAKKRKTMDVEEDMHVVNNTVAELFSRDQLQKGETLNFAESGNVEFKHFSTDKFSTRVDEILPRYISGFANACGGYLWIGVDDNRVVQGFRSDDEGLKSLRKQISSVQEKLTIFHFCKSRYQHKIKYEYKIFEVYDEAVKHCGYVCAVKVEPFTCAVFSEDPQSWLVDSGTVKRLEANEWAEWVISADPDLSEFSETFKLELSVTDGPPRAKPVYSHQGLDNLDDLCEQLFPVKSHSLFYTPEKLIKDLFQEHQGLKSLIDEQLKEVSEGVVIFSRSWAVDVGLPEKQDVICDVLLLAKGMPPTLYTVCKPISEDFLYYSTCTPCELENLFTTEDYTHELDKHRKSLYFFNYSRCTALKLKEKLVNTGGYTHKLCIIPKLLTLSPSFSYGEGLDLNVQKLYPQNYSLINSVNVKNLLRSLILVLLNFKSFLSDTVGFEFLNLLSIEQYRLLSENLHRTKKLYVYGLPGTGKTVVALKVIEKIRNMFQCQQQEVLYICENQPLRDFVRKKNICQAVTRVAFMKDSYSDVKHIIIDEAQNFRDEKGDWYQKALDLTSSPELPEPGFLWIFLDYLQTTHCFSTGLPEPRRHDPVESLTKVVRNAKSIYCYLKDTMEEIVKNPTVDIPQERLQRLLSAATCAHGVEGHFEVVYMSDRIEIAKYVANHCHQYLKSGYSEKDIAILCNSSEEVETYRGILTKELRKSNILPRTMNGGLEEYTILDSFRRFSGLERMIVFGIIPHPIPMQHQVLKNILVSVASRANLKMHLLYETWDMGAARLYQ
ncbi:schlafen family member 13-like isoform X1 [Numida meleagris]|uniref:schlafen family member 13-like isoform X1 n=1 Tax=Numida meleagris TaxID=8996 RepID=UPI000B3DB0A4|nr:schlafen family member 13-like isoform X1 [Numida meleagris]XP_021271029.1 schlafen family member 13-like isoform X1 [Numida meleagris]XP_021271030.1 schlafen family member 13-like isoform X1 [Numida meleagris]